MKKTIVLACLALAGCSTTQVHRNSTSAFAPSSASQVQVLYSAPQRAYESIGIVSAKRYKPGWSDPTVADAIPQLQAAGAQLGADAVIVRSDRASNTRFVTVEAEAIKYAGSAPSPAPASAPQAPAGAPCASCAQIGKGF